MHLGHEDMLKRAFELGEEVHIFIGSANSPRNLQNPFIYAERRQMLDLVITRIMHDVYNYPDIDNGPFVRIWPLNDILDDNDAWLKQITDIVGHGNYVSVPPFDGRIKHEIAYVGGAKKEWYVPLFEKVGYEHRQIPPYKTKGYEGGKFGGDTREEVALNSTQLRETYFTGYYDEANKILKERIPAEIYDYLMDYRRSSSQFVGYINSWYWKKKEDNQKYGLGPFLTCDNIIQVGDEILLIRRKNHPGKGLWAVPGGYLDAGETFAQGAARELEEETNLRLPLEMFEDMEMFDAVGRSTHARIITASFHVRLPVKPETKAGDDAAERRWFTRAEIEKMHNLMHDDHWYMLKKRVGF